MNSSQTIYCIMSAQHKKDCQISFTPGNKKNHNLININLLSEKDNGRKNRNT